jgi:GxxExxY protein
MIVEKGDNRPSSDSVHMDTENASRFRGARRHDDTTTRRSLGMRLESTLGQDLEQLVSRVMDCAFTVHRVLGPGFKESIYKQAFCLEMDSQGLKFECEKPILVRYKQWTIPGQRVDLLVESAVLVEIKAVPKLRNIHASQVLSYLKTMDLRIALLVNFKAALLKDGLRRVVR